MVDKKRKTEYLYESPDSGKSVFRHKIGKPETKELIKVGDDDLDIIEDDELQDWINSYNHGYNEPEYTWTDDTDWIFSPEWDKSFKEEITWKDIKAQAETHPALKAILDQMMTVYHLSKEEDNNGN